MTEAAFLAFAAAAAFLLFVRPAIGTRTDGDTLRRAVRAAAQPEWYVRDGVLHDLPHHNVPAGLRATRLCHDVRHRHFPHAGHHHYLTHEHCHPLDDTKVGDREHRTHNHYWHKCDRIRTHRVWRHPETRARLQANALRCLLHIERYHLGYEIRLTGSYRPRWMQVRAYRAKPGLVAPPGTSLHEKGLAIDVHTGVLDRRPEIRRLLRAHGWKQFAPKRERWHFSYRITG